MEGVDEIKIAPHEPIAPVHARQATLHNAGPRIEFSPGGETVLLQQLRGHATWPEWYSVIAVTLIQPPVFVEQSPFVMQPLVEGRAGKWREMIERSDIERLRAGKCNRLSKTLQRVAVVAEDERSIDPDPMLAQIHERFFKTAPHRVKGFVHVPEIFRIQTLKTNQHALTAA